MSRNQKDLLLNIRRFDIKKIQKDSIIVVLGKRNVGKCLNLDTPVLMYDGKIKKIQDIIEGELVMGDDSTPRKVLSTTTGEDIMYDVVNKRGEKYTVNSEHIISMKYTAKKNIFEQSNKNRYRVEWFNKNTIKMQSKTFNYSGQDKNEVYKEAMVLLDSIVDDTYVDIPIKTFIGLSKKYKENLLGYQVPVIFNTVDLPIDPYMIGYWLGDGHTNNSYITSQDSTVLHYFRNNLAQYNCYLKYGGNIAYRINGSNQNDKNGKYSNYFMKHLRSLNLLFNKHVPHIYKCNSRENQLKLLAGFIDADGHYSMRNNNYEICKSIAHSELLDDIIYIARSLGFLCTKQLKKTSWTYKGVKIFGEAYRIHINGSEEIPVLIPRKKSNTLKSRRSTLFSAIIVTEVGIDKYYGFELDKNHRFVLGNFIVTHNSVIIKDLLYHNRDIPIGTVISRTDHLVHYYDKFIPGMLVHKEFSNALLDKVFKRQIKAIDEGWANPYAFLLMDDCLSDAREFTKSKFIEEIFYNGRHYKLLYILAMQAPMGIPPGFRTNIDFTFIFKNNNGGDRERIYKNYANMFPSKEAFEIVLDNCTEDYNCLVIDNTTSSNKLEDQVFYYKAGFHDNLRLCNNNYWNINNEFYSDKKSSNSNILQERTTVIPTKNGKSSIIITKKKQKKHEK